MLVLGLSVVVSPPLSPSQSQAELAATIAHGIDNEGETYFNCGAAPSVQALCPTVPAHLNKDSLDLEIPPGARWIFEGPSWQREIYLTFAIANGGCAGGGVGSNRKQLFEHASSTALQPEEMGSSSKPCVLSNGAVIAFLDGDSEPGWVRSQTWTHGFFMQPHNEEYWQEHERAGREHRGPTYDAFADADGRDMCVPMDYEKVAWPNAKAFDEYVDCTHSKPYWPAFEDILRLDGTPLTLVVPWAIPAPGRKEGRHNNSSELWKKLECAAWCSPNGATCQEPACGGCEACAPQQSQQQGQQEHHAADASPAAAQEHQDPYFTRERATSIDCRARRVESADQRAAKPGFLSSDTSIAEENMADPDKPSQALDHQCVTVCEGDGDSTSCFPGSIVWMAHDLRVRAEAARKVKAVW